MNSDLKSAVHGNKSGVSRTKEQIRKNKASHLRRLQKINTFNCWSNKSLSKNRSPFQHVTPLMLGLCSISESLIRVFVDYEEIIRFLYYTVIFDMRLTLFHIISYNHHLSFLMNNHQEESDNNFPF